MIYAITSFNGGMTDDIRNTNDLSKCALISHFDMYRDPQRLFVMPGYVADNGFGGNANGLKVYGVKALHYLGGAIINVLAVGRRADNTGSKLFTKASPTTNEWSAQGSEGVDNLSPFSFLQYDGQRAYYATEAAGVIYLARHNLSAVTEKHYTIGTFTANGNFNTIRAYDNKVYAVAEAGNIIVMQAGTATTAKAYTFTLGDISTADEVLGVLGNTLSPVNSRLILYDPLSQLNDQYVEFGPGRAAAVGYVGGVWVGVVSEGQDQATIPNFNNEANGRFTMAIKAAIGFNADTLYRYHSTSNTDASIHPNSGKYRDSMLWYARLPVTGGFLGGVWAVGKTDVTSPIAISVPFNTESLGAVSRVYNFGSHYYFIHGGDGSLSRLDSFSGTNYAVAATYDSLVFGADSPYEKTLDGISIRTEDLPASASIQVQYRKDEQAAWISMGTSSTTGAQRHNFSRASGAPIGRFQEIQFRVIATGNIALKSIHIGITPTADLPFRLT